MSVKDMKKIAGGERYELENLPKEIDLEVTGYEFRKDKMGKDCIYVNFQGRPDEEGKTKQLTQKYSSMHIPYLVEAMEKLKINHIDKLKGYYHYEQTTFRIGNPRLFPTEAAK